MKQAHNKATLETDKTIINSMINDMHYAIDWMRHGGDPDRKRGVDRVAVYLNDPEWLDTLENGLDVINPSVSDQDKNRIICALMQLTEREEDVFIMHYAELLSFEEIADLLNVNKGTVGTTINRARKKLSKYLAKENHSYEFCSTNS
jgi:RNA polymerase sigma-70 factor (ECF subfamily)